MSNKPSSQPPATEQNRSPRNRRPPTIWIVTEMFYPEETSTGFVMTKIAEGLARHFPVRVLCAQPTYSARGTRAPRTEVWRNVDIRRVRSTTGSNERILTKVINLITITGSLFLNALLRVRRGDRVIAVTTPAVLPYAIGIACFLRRAECIAYVQDTYPEVLVAAGVCRSDSLIAGALNLANRILYRFSTRVIVVGRGMQERVRSKLAPGDPAKVGLIRNWADTDVIEAHPRRGSEFLHELGIDDKFVVQYAGNISRLNDIENLVEAVDALRGDPGIQLMVVGRGARREWLEQQVRERGLTNLTLVPWLPRSKSPAMHRGCDAVLIPLVPGMGGVAVPSRLYNSLASGRAIIAVTEENSELARIVSEEKVGWVVPPGNPQRLASAIREAASDPEVILAMGRRARASAEARFSRERVIGDWVALMNELDSA